MHADRVSTLEDDCGHVLSSEKHCLAMGRCVVSLQSKCKVTSMHDNETRAGMRASSMGKAKRSDHIVSDGAK